MFRNKNINRGNKVNKNYVNCGHKSFPSLLFQNLGQAIKKN